MKKTWLFGMAFTLGVATIPGVASAQYAPTYAPSSYGSGALAPSGYPVGNVHSQAQPQAQLQPQDSLIPQVSIYAQPAPYQPTPQFVQQPQFAPDPYALPQNGQYAPQPQTGYAQSSVPVQMIAYPQDTGSVLNNNSAQQPEEVWPQVEANQLPPQQQGIPQPMPLQTHGGAYAAPHHGPGYGAQQGYAQGLAPAATGGLYAPDCNSGACGGAVVASQDGSWLSNHVGAPGRAWFVGSGALLMRRVDDNNYALTLDSNMPTYNVLSTRDARQHYLNGFEVFAGRYFNCGRNAVMVNYWGLFPSDESVTIVGGGYSPRHPFNGIDLTSRNAYDWFDGAYAHRLTRSSEYHNVEANLLGFAVGGAARTWSSDGCGCGYGAFNGPCCLAPNVCGSRCNVTWLAGVRWFRFNDNLQWAASDMDRNFNGGYDDLYYDNNVTNDLVGFQVGGVGNYCLGKRVNLYALSKAGIYNNHSEVYSRIGVNGGSAETATIMSANAYNGREYLVNASQNNAAFLGEIGTGMGVRISRGWSANIGYRVIGASGVATAVNTIPAEMLHLGNVAQYNNTSSLLLHGLTIGGTYNF